MKLTIDMALQQAIEAHKAGKLQDAERLYRAILRVQPNHPDVNHNLGVLAVGVGKPQEALPYLKFALEANRSNGQFWVSYINGLIEAKQINDARKILEAGKRIGLSGETVTQLEEKLNEKSRTGISAQMAAYQANVDANRSLYLDFPAHIHLETLASCNASCNFCPYPTLDRKGEKMGDELLSKIISDLDDIPKYHEFQLSPFKVNEPFLDVRLFDILEEIQTKLPNASITLTSNSSPITEKKLERLAQFTKLGYLWISFNDHRKAEYEKTMGLPYDRTIERLRMIHKKKSEGLLKPRVVLSRVGDGTRADHDFVAWVKSNYPFFETSIFPRGEWLGQTGRSISEIKAPNVGCVRWFDLSITATGVVAHCCMDGKAEYPIGDANKKHLLEIYNGAEYRRLRELTKSRHEVSPCNKCSFL